MRLLCLLAVLGCNPSGTLYLSGREPGTLIRVDAATGTITTRTGVREMGGGDAPYMVHFTGGRLVTFALGRSHSFAPDVTQPKSLGESWFYVPSSTPGRIWNILRTPHSNVTFRGVREMAVDGRTVVTRRWKVPGWPLGAVTDGLVLQRRRGLEVFDPLTQRFVRRVPGTFPIAFRGNVIASCPSPCDPLYLDDRPVSGPFSAAWRGAFSPDGTLLAVGATRRRIAVVDVARGTVSLIPGARLDEIYGRVTWASSGWLFWNAGEGKLGAWRPGVPARELGVTVGPLIDMTSD